MTAENFTVEVYDARKVGRGYFGLVKVPYSGVPELRTLPSLGKYEFNDLETACAFSTFCNRLVDTLGDMPVEEAKKAINNFLKK